MYRKVGSKSIVHTVKPVSVATSTERATCIKQACTHSPKIANTLKCTCIKQAPVLSKDILIHPFSAYLIQVGLSLDIRMLFETSVFGISREDLYKIRTGAFYGHYLCTGKKISVFP